MEQTIDSLLVEYSSRAEREGSDTLDPLDDSDDDGDDGYASPNEISSENLHRTLNSILSEEKEKQQRNRRNHNFSGKSTSWPVPKSPMDEVFRTRLGGFDKPALDDVAQAFDDDEEKDDNDEGLHWIEV